MQCFEVDLPWPDPKLGPNARVHYMALARLRKEAKNFSIMKTRMAIHAAKISRIKPVGKVNIQLMPCPPTRHGQDEDNLLAKLKAALDGIAYAMGVDDKNFHFLEQAWFPAKKPGKVIVRVSWEEK